MIIDKKPFLPVFMRSLSGNITTFSLIIATIFGFLAFWPLKTLAQDATGVGLPIPFDRDDLPDSSIVCSTHTGYDLCSKPYSGEIFGVINKTPPVSFQVNEQEVEGNLEYVMSTGTTSVRVSNSAGNIEAGNLITSSENEGVGIKSERDGFVLGSALQDFSSEDESAEGIILVSLDIHPSTAFTNASGTGGNLLAALRQGLTASIFEPLASLRYVLAALLILIAFTLGFIYFGKLAQTGIEALGRNPLASGSIRRSMVLHILITIIIVLTGLFGAYLVLIL